MKLSAQPLAVCAAAAAMLFAFGPAGFAQDAPAITAADVAQPDGWDDEFRLAEISDQNGDPAIIEFALEASITDLEILPGTTTPAWTYNGALPGPVIRARVGDRLIVHFTNNLPEATTIHWHGVRVPNAMDGAPGVNQVPIDPGQSFTYDFVLRDAGTFWYHPHFNSPTQVSRGLYGALIVTDPAEPVFADELVVMLSDISLNPDGSFRPADQGGAFGDLFGREGSTVLANGRVEPTLKVRAGKQQRWRIIDAAITRYFPIAVRGHSWVRVGGDGGLAARSEQLPRLMLTPGERADVIFTPAGAPGTTQIMSWLAVDRGWGTSVGGLRVPILHLQTVDEPPVTPVAIPADLRAIEPLDIGGAEEKTVELTIQLDDPSLPMMGVNHVPHEFMIQAKLGETQVWNIVNNSDFDHPFHVHGYFFQVLDDSRTPEWKDTVNVPDHSALRIAIRFDERPGMWMFHCHILDHAEQGMMGLLFVGAGDEAAPATGGMAGMHHAH